MGQQQQQGQGGGGLYGTLNHLDFAKRLGLPSAFPGAHLFKKNRSAMGDIQDAMSRGLPISDAAWARIGRGPGGRQQDPGQTDTQRPSPMQSGGLHNFFGSF
jgi:hypothetical protein